MPPEVHKCASCPALTVPSLTFLSFIENDEVYGPRVLRGWQAGDGRYFCVLCVVSGGMYAKRGQ